MSANIAEILRAHGFVPTVPTVSPPTGDAETQVGRHVPTAPTVPVEKHKGAITAAESRQVEVPATEPAFVPAATVTRLVIDFRLRDHPSQWLTMLSAPGEHFDHALHDLQIKYGGRLIAARQHVRHS